MTYEVQCKYYQKERGVGGLRLCRPPDYLKNNKSPLPNWCGLTEFAANCFHGPLIFPSLCSSTSLLDSKVLEIFSSEWYIIVLNKQIGLIRRGLVYSRPSFSQPIYANLLVGWSQIRSLLQKITACSLFTFKNTWKLNLWELNTYSRGTHDWAPIFSSMKRRVNFV